MPLALRNRTLFKRATGSYAGILVILTKVAIIRDNLVYEGKSGVGNEEYKVCVNKVTKGKVRFALSLVAPYNKDILGHCS